MLELFIVSIKPFLWRKRKGETKEYESGNL